jgi:hypothetical protein
MRFFTIDWWMRYQSDPTLAQGPNNQYQQHLSSIRDRLPADLLRVAEEAFLHDGVLRRLVVEPEGKMAQMTIDVDDSGAAATVNLEYLQVQHFEFFGPLEPAFAGRCGAGFGHLGFWEVDVAGEAYEHRLLFATGIELLVRFGAFRMTGAPAPGNSD